MADIRPLRFTKPAEGKTPSGGYSTYDKITPGMQERYYASPLICSDTLAAPNRATIQQTTQNGQRL
jgi:hypothetical protein